MNGRLGPDWHTPASKSLLRLWRQAERDSSTEELRIVREEAARWESRVNELLLKYGSVDLAEHNRVADALKVRCR